MFSSSGLLEVHANLTCEVVGTSTGYCSVVSNIDGVVQIRCRICGLTIHGQWSLEGWDIDLLYIDSTVDEYTLRSGGCSVQGRDSSGYLHQLVRVHGAVHDTFPTLRYAPENREFPTTKEPAGGLCLDDARAPQTRDESMAIENMFNSKY